MSTEGVLKESEELKRLTGKVVSVPLVDKTLTKSGQAADARIVGKEIKVLGLKIETLQKKIETVMAEVDNLKALMEE